MASNDHEAALRALDRIASRLMLVDATGVEHPKSVTSDEYSPNFCSTSELDDTGMGPSIYVDCKGEIPKPMGKTFRRILTEELSTATTITKARVITADAARGRAAKARERALSKIAGADNPQLKAVRFAEQAQSILMIGTDFSTNSRLSVDEAELRNRGWSVVTIPDFELIEQRNPVRPDLIVICGSSARGPLASAFGSDADRIISALKRYRVNFWLEPGAGPITPGLATSAQVTVADHSLAEFVSRNDLRPVRRTPAQRAATLLARTVAVALVYDEATHADAIAAQDELRKHRCVSRLVPVEWMDEYAKADRICNKLRQAKPTMPREDFARAFRGPSGIRHRLFMRFQSRCDLAVIHSLPADESGLSSALAHMGATSIWVQPDIELTRLRETPRDVTDHRWLAWMHDVDFREAARNLRLSGRG